IGVLTLYSHEPNSFTEDHKRIIEVVGRHISVPLKRSVEFDDAPRRDTLTGLPNGHVLDELIRSSVEESGTRVFALLVIDVSHIRSYNDDLNRAGSDELLRALVKTVRGNLRVADILFRNSTYEFVAFLNATDFETARALGVLMRQRISEKAFQIDIRS